MLFGLSTEDQQGVSAFTNHQTYQLSTYNTLVTDDAEHTNGEYIIFHILLHIIKTSFTNIPDRGHTVQVGFILITLLSF